MRAESLLKLVLRAVGTVLLFALPAMFAPMSWMAAVHEQIGLGEMPGGPVIEYLIRSISFGYVLSGVFMWLVSFDLRRHATVITFLGEASVLFGLFMTIVDWRVALPWWWTVNEGPPAILLGVLILYLQSKARSRL